VAQKSIEQTVKEIMVERLYLKIKPEEIRDETPIMEELGVDSVSVFEIVVGLEEEYGISMEDDEFRIQTFRTPRSIADFVRRKLKERDENA
jgi:acyl carrier protein